MTKISAPIKVLLTGFEPFLDNSYNTSQLVLERITDQSNHKDTIQYTTNLLTVDSNGVKQVSLELAKSSCSQYDTIIHLGLDSKASKIYIELCAWNYKVTNSDQAVSNLSNRGDELPVHCIDPDSPALLVSTFDFSSYSALNEDDKIVALSRNAGIYYCNEIYFRTLDQIRKNVIILNDKTKKPVKCCFIHLPQVSERLSISFLTKKIDDIVYFLTLGTRNAYQ